MKRIKASSVEMIIDGKRIPIDCNGNPLEPRDFQPPTDVFTPLEVAFKTDPEQMRGFIDALIEQARRRNKILHEMAQAMFDEAIKHIEFMHRPKDARTDTFYSSWAFAAQALMAVTSADPEEASDAGMALAHAFNSGINHLAMRYEIQARKHRG